MSIILGIDHGYGYIKTANTEMITGVSAYTHEPHTLQNTLKFNDKYYVCGTSRQSLTRDKTSDDNYYYLTLAAIAKELQFRQYANTRADIIVAAGLPLTRFGREKEGFKSYLLRMPNMVDFQFEGRPYSIYIRDVVLFPQGYSALVSHSAAVCREPSVILADFGTWTLDVMRIDRGTPNADLCRSIELGLIRCLNEICEQVSRSFGFSVTEAQVEQVLRMENSILDIRVQNLILEHGQSYVKKVGNTLIESGFDTAATPVVFMGGGATLVKNFASHAHASYIEDIHANAKGYERIANQVRNSAKQQAI